VLHLKSKDELVIKAWQDLKVYLKDKSFKEYAQQLLWIY